MIWLMSQLDAAQAPSQAVDPLHLDQQLCYPMYAAGNLIARLYRPLLQPLGLTYPQYLVMLVLWEKQPCAVSELGERLLLDSGTLTPLLKRLQSAGWVHRERDPLDERRVLVLLTESGLALRQKARSVPHALFCRILGGSPTPEAMQHAAVLRDQLQALVRQLGQVARQPRNASASAEQP